MAMKQIRAFVIMGQYGHLFSSGMVTLNKQINAMDGVWSTLHTWGDYSGIQQAIQVSKGANTIFGFVGFSLGAGTAAELSRRLTENIHLIVGYDPSRLSPTAVNGIEYIPASVNRAVCYWNPGAWYVGGASYDRAKGNTKTHLSNVRINDWHLAVASREDLHERTKTLFRELRM